MVSVVTVPSDTLRQIAKPVAQIDNRILDLLKDMEDCLRKAKDPQGVGLAASQVGVPLRIFMTRPVKNGAIHTFINPEIIKSSQKLIDPHKKDGVYEGCLSIPLHYSPIKRAYSVVIKYQVLNNSPLRPPLNLRGGSEGALPELVEKTETFTGFAAHVVQHEMDHLNGILFIDRALAQNAKIYKIEGEEWMEVGI